MTISNKIKTLVIEYPDDNPDCAKEFYIPLHRITGLFKSGRKYTFMADGCNETSISEEVFEELKKHFEPVVIESRE